MRSIEYSVTGGPEVLTLVDRALPDPGAGEVRVRIHRSGVNPTDWKSRRGDEAGVAVDPPQVPNQDGSGVVDAVGQGVEAALLGLRVWIWEAALPAPAGGTAQEFAVVPAHHVVLPPRRRLRRPRRQPRGAVPDRTPVPDRQRGRPHAARTRHPGGPHRAGGGRRRGGRQRRHPARPMVRRHRHHHGQQPREGAPRSARRRRPRHQLHHDRTSSPRCARSRRTA